MRRNSLGLGAAACAFVMLAWVWPDGSAPDAAEPTASPSQAEQSESPESGAPESEAPESAPPASEEPDAEEPEEPSPSESAAPAPVAYEGPLGTRNHTGTATVALTFDDGPDPEWTPTVLAALRERGVKATFCVIGAYAEANPEIIADIVHEGHSLCSHAWFHELDLGKRSEAEIRANLQRTNDAIEKAAPGAEVEYFRQPGGQWTDRVVDVAAELGMESLHWTVDPSDWDEDTTAAEIRDHVLDESGPGAIVLLHDGAANQEDMLKALDAILDEFERRGYALVAL